MTCVLHSILSKTHLTPQVDLLFRVDEISFHPVVLNFLPIYFPSTFVQIWKAWLVVMGVHPEKRLDS